MIRAERCPETQSGAIDIERPVSIEQPFPAFARYDRTEPQVAILVAIGGYVSGSRRLGYGGDRSVFFHFCWPGIVPIGAGNDSDRISTGNANDWASRSSSFR